MTDLFIVVVSGAWIVGWTSVGSFPNFILLEPYLGPSLERRSCHSVHRCREGFSETDLPGGLVAIPEGGECLEGGCRSGTWSEENSSMGDGP